MYPRSEDVRRLEPAGLEESHTAKRLRIKARGCHASWLPWGIEVVDLRNPIGVETD
jgi:hypothetical protein